MILITTFPDGEQIIFDSQGRRTVVLAHHKPDTKSGNKEQPLDTPKTT